MRLRITKPLPEAALDNWPHRSFIGANSQPVGVFWLLVDHFCQCVVVCSKPIGACCQSVGSFCHLVSGCSQPAAPLATQSEASPAATTSGSILLLPLMLLSLQRRPLMAVSDFAHLCKDLPLLMTEAKSHKEWWWRVFRQDKSASSSHTAPEVLSCWRWVVSNDDSEGSMDSGG
ncbi:hypothetical protein PIB30_043367 [Stylosanthes scabra]|uniref:Uncharacterized protein n=1 Tax=Stylosanthes scabra TaxID=79078 RepID=A0ABU6XDG2_9FABA|nr:hypothetical protein [Stylosanthes scabra]